MPYYLQQVAYTIEGWNALVNKPQDRIEGKSGNGGSRLYRTQKQNVSAANVICELNT